MMKYVQSGWFAMMAGALVYLGVTVALIGRSPALKGGVANAAPEDFPGAGPAWDFVNPELDRLISELKKEKEALNQREQQLKELAARLDAERTELNIVTQAVYRMRSEMEKDVVRVREEETANLKRLAKMYASMSPEGAAAILKQMEDEAALKFLVFMKDAESGPLLEALGRLGEAEAKRAATLTDRLRSTVYRSAVAKPPQ